MVCFYTFKERCTFFQIFTFRAIWTIEFAPLSLKLYLRPFLCTRSNLSVYLTLRHRSGCSVFPTDLKGDRMNKLPHLCTGVAKNTTNERANRTKDITYSKQKKTKQCKCARGVVVFEHRHIIVPR